nr:MAG TPA: Protein of unknown function (DUF2755) [Bacteriophage sp.]
MNDVMLCAIMLCRVMFYPVLLCFWHMSHFFSQMVHTVTPSIEHSN